MCRLNVFPNDSLDCHNLQITNFGQKLSFCTTGRSARDTYFNRHCSFTLTRKNRNVGWIYVSPLEIRLNMFLFTPHAIPDRNSLFVRFRLRFTPTKPSALISLLLFGVLFFCLGFRIAEFKVWYGMVWNTLFNHANLYS